MVKSPCFATFMLSKGKSQINPREFMILNKFRPVTLLNRAKAVGLQLLAFCLFSCNKTASENANKAYIGMAHVAYGVDSLNFYFAGIPNPLFPVSIAFGQNSGTSGNTYYDTATSRINNIFLYKGNIPDTTTLLQGNSAFQQGGRYSIFVYDALNQQSINLIIFQDNPVFQNDTVTNFRYVNFLRASSLGDLNSSIHGKSLFLRILSSFRAIILSEAIQILPFPITILFRYSLGATMFLPTQTAATRMFFTILRFLPLQTVL